MGQTSQVAEIRTFHPRRGRLGTRNSEAMRRLWPALGYTLLDGPGARLDLPAWFGRTADVVLDIGFGTGEATAELAAAHPDTDRLAVEVHTPGIAALLHRVEADGLTNVRVVHGDALELLRHRLSPGGLAGITIFFPDPWPKARHHKRRLVRERHLPLLRDALAAGGTLHCATDWPDYAERMLAVLAADPGLRNAYPGFAPGPGDRPPTKFEQRGRAAGRPVVDLVFHKVVAA